jgi:two-component sensor histidine kinase
MGERTRAFDWSSTSLGSAEEWPQSLRTTVGIVLRSPVAMALLWGEDGIMIYNDAYSVFARARHPQLLAMKVREAWPEAAGFNDNVMKVGLAGGTLSYKDQELTLYRNGAPEPVWMNLDYSPVLDEGGKPAGVIAIVVETTERVSAERRVQAERERLQQLFKQAPGFMAMLSGREHVFELANPAYMQIVGHRDILGKSVREAFPEVAGQGFFELLDQVFETGEAYQGSAMKVGLQRVPNTAVEERYVDFVYQPIIGRKGDITGIFVEGYDVTERVRADAHLRLLMDELNHRLKNTLTTMQAIVARTLRGPGSLDEAREALSGRIMALSRAQDVLTNEKWYGASLAKVVEVSVAPPRWR